MPEVGILTTPETFPRGWDVRMNGQTGLIHFDNASTSFPKPPGVAAAIADLLGAGAVSPGRSGFDLGLELGRLIDGVRAQLDRFFANPADDPNRTVFCANATDAINLAVSGLCRPGDHVVATVMDHNAVLRPLWMLREAGVISFDLAPADGCGFVDPAAVAALIRPQTRLVVMTHASNVCGAIQPAAAVGALCRERGVTFLLDAAQSAGVLPVDMAALGCDLVAFTGHKGLLGPTGIGGLVVGPGVEVRSTRWGGTGVRSEERAHLTQYPYRLEAGTLNTVGIVGLGAGLAWVQEHGVDTLRTGESALADRFLAGVGGLPGLVLHGFAPGEARCLGPHRLPTVAVTATGRDPAMLGQFLDADWNIAVRTGLQCAPLAHAALGTAPEGTVRFSFGPFNNEIQVDHAIAALTALTT